MQDSRRGWEASGLAVFPRHQTLRVEQFLNLLPPVPTPSGSLSIARPLLRCLSLLPHLMLEAVLPEDGRLMSLDDVVHGGEEHRPPLAAARVPPQLLLVPGEFEDAHVRLAHSAMLHQRRPLAQRGHRLPRHNAP